LPPLWIGVATVTFIAAASILAFVLTMTRCGGDGSFDPLLAPNRSSAYCKTLHFPSLPNTVRGALLSIGIFLVPTIIASFGTAKADRAGSTRPLLLPAAVSLGIVAIGFILIPAAHVTFVPVG